MLFEGSVNLYSEIIAALIFGALILFLALFKLSPVNSSSFFSKTQTDKLRGIAIMLIIFCHYFQKVHTTEAFSKLVYSSLGAIGVGIFFMLSGYGLMTSKMKKVNYTKGFLKNKLLRIYSVCFIGYILVSIIFLISKTPFNNNIFLEFITFSLPNTLMWYLKVQVGMYVLFWIASIILKNKSNKSFAITILVVCIIYMAVCFITDVQFVWYENTLFFPAGIFLAMYKDKVYSFMSKRYTLSLIVSILAFIVGVISALMFFETKKGPFELIYIFGFIVLLFTASVKISGNSRILDFFGKYSLELYISHITVCELLAFVDSSNVLYSVLFIILSVLLAIMIKFLSQKILKGIDFVLCKFS